MLLKVETLKGLRDGSITLAFRRWRRPTVKSGGTLLTPIGQLAVEAVERVLLQVFDHYDLWGVDPIQDRHFFSIPGTRVLVHAFEFDAPLNEDGYPEPDYESLARGRVLHIMKDRGGQGDADPLESLPKERPKLIPVHSL